MSCTWAGLSFTEAELALRYRKSRRDELVALSAPELIERTAKSVADGDCDPILLISPEPYLAETAVAAITTAWLGAEPDQFQLISLNCREFSHDEYLTNVLTFGMFAQRRLAILSDIDQLNTAEIDLVADSFDHLPPETLVVCTATTKKNIKSKLIKALQRAGKIIELPILRGMDLVNWLRKMAKAERLALDPQVEAELIATFSGDLNQLRSELAKLVAYKGASGGTVSIADLKAVMGRSSLHSIFNLTDALGEQNISKARAELQHLLNAGENPGYIVAMLQWHLANLWQCKAAPAADPQSLAKTLSIHPYVARKCVKQAANFKLATLENSYLLAVECEYRLKAGKAPRADVELDRLIVETVTSI